MSDADLVYIQTEHGLWRPNGEGYTTDKRYAGRWLRASAERATRHLGPEKQLRLIPVRADTAEQAALIGEEYVREQEVERTNDNRLPDGEYPEQESCMCGVGDKPCPGPDGRPVGWQAALTEFERWVEGSESDGKGVVWRVLRQEGGAYDVIGEYASRSLRDKVLVEERMKATLVAALAAPSSLRERIAEFRGELAQERAAIAAPPRLGAGQAQQKGRCEMFHVTESDKLLQQIWRDWTASLQDGGFTHSDGDEDKAAFLQVSAETFIAVRDVVAKLPAPQSNV